ncbi:hypothetical protein N7510_008005 [Penicillium lagena]|uniref:uncharacterized protein n=1 Tax=Penicillium lagena TaxID=94218 RepID=UPI002541CF9E|nr:uncharacterized protein N7510_008005 [Penicillium lagena]KAJ5611286.1 hypothetical protein N7510_008005 [Penicillium lagena]
MTQRGEDLVAESPETQLGTPGRVWADENSEQGREAAGSGSALEGGLVGCLKRNGLDRRIDQRLRKGGLGARVDR